MWLLLPLLLLSLSLISFSMLSLSLISTPLLLLCYIRCRYCSCSYCCCRCSYSIIPDEFWKTDFCIWFADMQEDLDAALAAATQLAELQGAGAAAEEDW